MRQCAYCGVRRRRGWSATDDAEDEILACARQGGEFGFGTVVIQAGEDPGLRGPFIADVCAINARDRLRRSR